MNKKLLILLTVLLGLTVQAQQQYSFIRYDANKLHYDTNAAAMQFLFQKWQRVTSTGQGTINIVHIGGSHVQAGTLPNRIRTDILKAYPKSVGGRGLIFPYSAAAKCNNPADYKVHCVEKMHLTRNIYRNPERPLGLCGISVTAMDQSSSIQIILRDKGYNYATTRIVVLGHSPQGVVPSIKYGQYSTMPSYIDSAKHRYIFNLHQAVDSFTVVMPCKAGQQFTLTGIYLASRNSGITYHSIGVNGASVPDYFKCSLTQDLSLVRPDLVIFGIGINDAHGKNFDSVAFKRNYLRLCDSIRMVNPHCAFIFITNNDSYRKTGKRSYSVNRNGLQVRDVCYRLANITGGAVWDQFEVMGGLSSMALWQKAGLAQADKVHFTHNGYLLIGDLFYSALEKELQRDWKPAKEVRNQKESNLKEKPLPRGLRHKPRRTVSTTSSSTSSQTNKTSTSDRFPYIPD